VHLEAGAVQEQVVQLDLVQTPGRPAVELVLDRLTDPAHGGLAQRGLRAEGVGEGGLHVAHGQAAHKPSDHQRLQRVGLGHPDAEESRREAFGGAAQLRPVDGDRSGGGLDRGRAVAVAGTRAGVLGVGRALVAGPAEELGHLGLHRGLDDQSGAQAGDILEDLDQVTVGGEQGIDLGTDAIGG